MTSLQIITIFSHNIVHLLAFFTYNRIQSTICNLISANVCYKIEVIAACLGGGGVLVYSAGIFNNLVNNSVSMIFRSNAEQSHKQGKHKFSR